MLRKYFLLIVCSIFLFSACSLVETNKEVQNNLPVVIEEVQNEGEKNNEEDVVLKKIMKEYRIPQKLDVTDRYDGCDGGSYCLEKHREICEEQYGCLADLFYPIGWSFDKNYFAYILEPADEAVGGYHFEMYIQNVVSDEIEWEWSYYHQNSAEYEEFEAYGEEDMITVWNTKRVLFFEKLNDYDIEQEENFAFSLFPLKTDKLYTVHVNEEREQNSDYPHQFIANDSIKLNAENLGSKTISNQIYPEYSRVLSSHVSGAIISDNYEKMMVVKIVKHLGWEGPPNVLRINLVGAHLEEGFEL